MFLKDRKDLSYPKGILQDARIPLCRITASLSFSDKGKAGKPKSFHHCVAWAEIPTPGLWLQSQAMAEGQVECGLLLILVTEQMFPVSGC